MNIINSYENLTAFFKKYESFDIEFQIEKFNLEFIELYKDYYASLLFGNNCDIQYKEKTIRKFLIEFSKYETNIFEKMKDFQTQVSLVEAEYKKHIPDSDFSNILVLSIPSLFTFDAMATVVEDGFGIVFGFDQIAKLELSNDYVFNYKVLMAHEFGHILHTSKLDIEGLDMSQAKLTLRLWFEGVALFLSKTLYSDTTLEELLFDKQIAKKCEDNEAFIIDAFLEDANCLRFGVEEDKWFKPIASSTNIPHRAGYYLGYKVLKNLSTKHTINELISLELSRIHDVVLDTLKSF